VQVNHLDRKPPTLTTRGSPSTVADLGGGRYGIFITSRHLQVSDGDSPRRRWSSPSWRRRASATWRTCRQVRPGVRRPGPAARASVSNVRPPGASIRGRFTQQDVDRRAVAYVIPADVAVTNDSFRFRLTDPAGNSAPPDLWVCGRRPGVMGVSSCSFLLVPAAWTCPGPGSSSPPPVSGPAKDGTAKVGGDFSHSSAGLVQFDPGVKVKTWSIFPVDDGLEENHETFTVLLKHPRNAVLGQWTSARVEISDPRGGEN
ncbi:unnamed protein product, partial [Tetraodon nigroviridis]